MNNKHENTKIKNLVDNILLGRFASLSCSSLVNVTSYYEGKAYYYVMTKDLDKLTIDTVAIIPTEEHNGVNVQIPVKAAAVENYVYALKSLMFIPNIYVNYIGDNNNYKRKVNNFNERVINSEYSLFKCCNYSTYKSNTAKILIGNIPYAIDTAKFQTYYGGLFREILTDIFPQFNIGDLDVTPNRESILYSERSINKINEVLADIYSIIYDLYKKKYNKDYTDFLEYWKNEWISSYKDITINGRTYRIASSALGLSAMFKGRVISKELYPNIDDFFRDLRCLSCEAVCTRASNGIIKRGDNNTKRTYIEHFTGSKWGDSISREKLHHVLVVPSNKGFASKYLEGYLNDYYADVRAVFAKQYYCNVNAFLKEHFINIGPSTCKETELRMYKWLLKQYLRELKPYIIEEDIMASEQYAQYKKDIATKKEGTKLAKEISFYVVSNDGHTDGWGYERTYKYSDMSDLFKFLQSTYLNYQWVYCEDFNSPELTILKHLRYNKKIMILSVAKTNSRVLKNLPSRFVHISKVFSLNNPEIYKLFASFNLHLNQVQNNEDYDTYKFLVKKLMRYLPEKERTKLQYFFNNYTDTNICYVENLPMFTSCNVEDKELTEGCNTLIHYIDVLKNTESIRSVCGGINSLYAYYCMKNKLLRMDGGEYLRLKKSLKVNNNEDY